MVSAQIRDIAIIIVALQSIVIGVLLAVLVWQIWRLIKTLQEDIKPIIEDAQETVGTVRGTTAFVSENISNPLIRTRSFFAGARQTARALRGEPTARSTPPSAATSAATSAPPSTPRRPVPSQPSEQPSDNLP